MCVDDVIVVVLVLLLLGRRHVLTAACMMARERCGRSTTTVTAFTVDEGVGDGDDGGMKRALKF